MEREKRSKKHVVSLAHGNLEGALKKSVESTLPIGGTALISIEEWEEMTPVAGGLRELGFNLLIPKNTLIPWKKKGIWAEKIGEKRALALLQEKRIHLVISTRERDRKVRQLAALYGVTLITTCKEAKDAVRTIGQMAAYNQRGGSLTGTL